MHEFSNHSAVRTPNILAYYQLVFGCWDAASLLRQLVAVGKVGLMPNDLTGCACNEQFTYRRGLLILCILQLEAHLKSTPRLDVVVLKVCYFMWTLCERLCGVEKDIRCQR